MSPGMNFGKSVNSLMSSLQGWCPFGTDAPYVRLG